MRILLDSVGFHTDREWLGEREAIVFKFCGTLDRLSFLPVVYEHRAEIPKSGTSRLRNPEETADSKGLNEGTRGYFGF